MFCKRPKRRFPGFTLIEVLVTIIVIGIAATAIMSVFTSTVRRSANPLIQQQAIAIAEAYIEEIQSKRFCEDLPVSLNAPSICSPLETGGAEAGESRINFDDIKDYNDASVDGGIVDQNNQSIAGLSAYSVDVAVVSAALSNTAGQTLTNAANEVVRIDVTVTHPAIDAVVLSVFRTNY